MHRVEREVEIDAAPDAVFPYLVDGALRRRWMGVLRETEELTDGPPAVGSRWRDVFEDLGRRIELEAELAVYEPPRRLLVKLTSRGIEATSEQRLQPTGGRTRLTAVIETDYRTAAARVAGVILTHRAQRQLEADLAALKGLVEEETG